MADRTHGDYYEILGVERNASSDEIKRAYRALVHRYHPDLNPDDSVAVAKFKEISEAYGALSDPADRDRYDSQMRRAGPRSTQARGRPPRDGSDPRAYSVGLSAEVAGMSSLGSISFTVQGAGLRTLLRHALRELIKTLD